MLDCFFKMGKSQFFSLEDALGTCTALSTRHFYQIFWI